MSINSSVKYGLFIVFFYVSPLLLSAQVGVTDSSLSTLRVKKFILQGNQLVIDTVPIVPGTVEVQYVASTTYWVDPVKATLYWKNKPSLDSVTIYYRVFPNFLNTPVQLMQFDKVTNRYLVPSPAKEEFKTNRSWGFSGIQSQGSLGRQIGFGNRQDAVVNSTLNLQLNGWLPDSIQLSASIADQQMPIQPDGSTRQLQEFDQILLEFRKKNWQLQVGDIDLRANKDYFLNFYKRMQGVGFTTAQQINADLKSVTTISGAIAKGKFSRQQLETREGNQGPYRLQGPRNEYFLVVLANSERVYYDGILLQRGEDQDYVINYNTAEIRFTPKRMISKDSRVQVEFEYAERNYLNSNLYLDQELQWRNKWKFRLSAFQNTDARNSTINQSIDPMQRSFLSRIGDSIQKAFYPSAYLDSSGKSSILYEKVMVGADSFYRYSVDATVPRYAVSFTEVGVGNGNYIPDPAIANGKVYQYVSPVNGVKQGRFEPILFLVTPKQQQIVAASLSYTGESENYFKTELSTSKTDLNRFASTDKGDNRGWAIQTTWKQRLVGSSKKTKALLLTLSHEYIDKKFTPLERLRAVEFFRDWGLQYANTPVTEHILAWGLQWKHKQRGGWEYQSMQYKRTDQYKGWQHYIKQQQNLGAWKFNNLLTLTHYSTTGFDGKFFRPSFDIRRKLRGNSEWNIGLSYQLEDNSVRNQLSKQLQAASFRFDQVSIFISSDEQKANRYSLKFYTRSDFAAAGDAWKKSDRSFNWQFETDLLKTVSQQLFVNATLRKLKVLNPQWSVAKEDWTLLSRVQYRFKKWKGLLEGNLLYELGSGQEQRRDLVFVEVPAGQGEYAWIDYNQDGVQQLNEFEWAQFPDQAKFVRLFTPTNDFIKADQVTFNYQVSLQPRRLLTTALPGSLSSFWARFSANSSWQYNQKTFANGTLSWNPFKRNYADTALISLQGIFSNTISFNRFSTKWGVDLTQYATETKAVLSYGFEQRKQQDWLFKLRSNWNRNLASFVEFKRGLLQLSTPAYANRNYFIEEYKVKPQLQWVKGTSLLINGSYQYQLRKNQLRWGGEQSKAQVWMGELRINKLQKGALSSKLSLHQINYPHAISNTVSYVMLDGLVPGTNWVWMCGYQRRITEKLELNLQYDGRKAGQSKAIHMGRAGVTALF